MQLPTNGATHTPSRSFSTSDAMRRRAHDVIPGGAHTYNKGDDQYPEHAPGFIVRGQGCHVWDADGNEFIEYGMGSRAVSLGHGFAPVVEAAYKQMQQGTNYTRPARIEMDYAEALLDLIDAAEQVKFAKDGSTVTTAAVKLARAHTGRDMVAVCADHPFLSYNDWFIGTTAMDAGIPGAARSLTVSFSYNDLPSLQALFDRYPGKIACIILEPAHQEEPRSDFLKKALSLCHANGALFILDEMITGFRWHLRGGQALYGVTPDLSCFGKAMANGFALSALLGKRDIMELGGLRHSKDRVFLLSTTHGAETHALAAALETLKTYREASVIDVLYDRGRRLARGVRQAAEALGVQDYFQVVGRPCDLVYRTCGPDHRPSQPYRTLFLQELIRRGILAPSFVVSYSHSEADIDRTVEAVYGALKIYKEALYGGIDSFLTGRSVQPVFRRRNQPQTHPPSPVLT